MDSKDELQDGFDEVASLDEGIEESQAGLPTDSDGFVPGGLMMRMSRPDKSHEKRGIVFTVEDGNDDKKRKAVMFAHQRGGFIAGSSKQEILFLRGFLDGKQVGFANFHHWIKDQSRSIIVQNALGQETDLRRSNVTWTHTFEVGERKLKWQRESGETKTSKLTKPHLSCVDEQGEVYAFYTQQRRRFCYGAETKTMGELEIRKEGLSVVEVETLMMTLTAVWVKYGKRVIQGSQAGWGGGLGAAVLYVIGG